MLFEGVDCRHLTAARYADFSAVVKVRLVKGLRLEWRKGNDSHHSFRMRSVVHFALRTSGDGAGAARVEVAKKWMTVSTIKPKLRERRAIVITALDLNRVDPTAFYTI